YIKQLNRLALDKDMAVALYGVRKEEQDTAYLFLYGACKLTFLQRETGHLSQTQKQEIIELGEKYFEEYSFLGYRLLNGEMIEGFHICDGGDCHYVQGYAQFYEKNDSMLAYMLEARNESAPEQVNQEKYEMVKKRQEQRRSEQEQNQLPQKAQTTATRKTGKSIVAVLAICCLLGISFTRERWTTEDVQTMARQVLQNLTEPKLQGKEDTLEKQETSTLIAEDRLVEAVLQENAQTVEEPATKIEEMEERIENTDEEVSDELPDAVREEVPETTKEPDRSYMIREGDTLIGISISTYGSDEWVSEICRMNGISDPDDIKVGQKILLP
ncbi:MAG: LysM peptidoglycan-binding domain-containing protein, partial [Acetatifactor sp.]|nr:LysM peptidoglycan-binding domain-containing protein [Acetatifactor sp.]